MRTHVNPEKLRLFMEEIGRIAHSPGRIYLVGGATALLLNFREQTVDIDLKLDPEPKGVFEAIAELKDPLDVNVELASPDHFLPPLPGWQDRSEPIAKHGRSSSSATISMPRLSQKFRAVTNRTSKTQSLLSEAAK